MSAPMLNQPNTLLANMFAAGLLDDQFQELQMLQEGSAPDFIVKVFTLFCEDGKRIIGEITNLLDKPCVDYDKVSGFVHRLKGSSARLGAQRVKNRCIQFHHCCQKKSRDGCLNSLDSVRNNFKPHASAGPAGPGINPEL